MFSQDAEHPLIGSTITPWNVLLVEVRETARRFRLRKKKSKKAKSIFPGRNKEAVCRLAQSGKGAFQS